MGTRNNGSLSLLLEFAFGHSLLVELLSSLKDLASPRLPSYPLFSFSSSVQPLNVGVLRVLPSNLVANGDRDVFLSVWHVFPSPPISCPCGKAGCASEGPIHWEGQVGQYRPPFSLIQ